MNKHTVKGFVLGVATTMVIGVSGMTYAVNHEFTDIEGKWYENTARWAEKVGLINGYSDGEFKGDDYITRGEMTAILKRMSDRGMIDVKTPKLDTSEYEGITKELIEEFNDHREDLTYEKIVDILGKEPRETETKTDDKYESTKYTFVVDPHEANEKGQASFRTDYITVTFIEEVVVDIHVESFY